MKEESHHRNPADGQRQHRPFNPIPPYVSALLTTADTLRYDLAQAVADYLAWRADDPREGSTPVLDPDVRRVLDGASIGHLATLLPDGAPHSVPVYVGTHGDRIVFLTGPGARKARNLRRDPRMALSIAPADDPFQPVLIRGRVVDWIEGDEAWEIIDRLVAKYVDMRYPRDQERVVAVIEPDKQSFGMS